MNAGYLNLLFISVWLSLFSFAVYAQEDTSSDTCKITKIYIIRHAERDPGHNPPLNWKGQKRAKLVKEMLADSGITVIYSPDLIRNRETAAPLAKALNITPKLVPYEILDDTYQVALYVKKHIWNEDLGKKILFIGNQKGSGVEMGNLQEFYKAIGGSGIPMSRYPDMHIITLRDTSLVKSVHVTYGEDASGITE